MRWRDLAERHIPSTSGANTDTVSLLGAFNGTHGVTAHQTRQHCEPVNLSGLLLLCCPLRKMMLTGTGEDVLTHQTFVVP